MSNMGIQRRDSWLCHSAQFAGNMAARVKKYAGKEPDGGGDGGEIQGVGRSWTW